jgi:hypothetical protein
MSSKIKWLVERDYPDHITLLSECKKFHEQGYKIYVSGYTTLSTKEYDPEVNNLVTSIPKSKEGTMNSETNSIESQVAEAVKEMEIPLAEIGVLTHAARVEGGVKLTFKFWVWEIHKTLLFEEYHLSHLYKHSIQWDKYGGVNGWVRYHSKLAVDKLFEGTVRETFHKISQTNEEGK